MLNQDGHDAVLVADGAEALAAVLASAFDLVLMDMQMPVMDGLEATRRIRALDSPAANVPIVALTANVMGGEIARCLEAGMNEHLAKPINRDSLRRVVATWGSEQSADPIAIRASVFDPPNTDVHAREDDPSEFNLKMLRAAFGGDDGVVADILAASLDSIETGVGRIRAGVEAHDAKGVIAAAHHLKGTFGELRTSRLTNICYRIERASQDDFWRDASPLLAELQRRTATLCVEIHTYAMENVVSIANES